MYGDAGSAASCWQSQSRAAANRRLSVWGTFVCLSLSKLALRALDNFRPSFYPIKPKTLLLLLPMRVITCRMRNVVSQWQQQPRCLAVRVCVLCWYWCLGLCLDYGFCWPVCGCRVGWLIERLTADRLTDWTKREHSGNFILNVPQHAASICLCFNFFLIS